MSEVKRYRAGDFVPVQAVAASDYDAAQSELDALREELATITQDAWEAAGGNPGIKATRDELLSALRLMNEADDEHDAMQQRLTAAEQRNATLSNALLKIIEMNRHHAEAQYGDADKAESWSCITVARAALKPTESGASE